MDRVPCVEEHGLWRDAFHEMCTCTCMCMYGVLLAVLSRLIEWTGPAGLALGVTTAVPLAD